MEGNPVPVELVYSRQRRQSSPTCIHTAPTKERTPLRVLRQTHGAGRENEKRPPCLHFFFFPIRCTVSALFFCLLPSRTSDPGSHTGSRLFSPLPTTGLVRAFLPSLSREHLSPFFLRRLASNCAYPLPTLGTLRISSSFFFLQINSKSHHGGNRTHGPTLLIVALEGNY